MSEEVFVLHSAPTLAGIKTANLFTIEYDDHDSIMKDIRNMNQLFKTKGICVIPLKEREKKVLIYVYRPLCLHRDFQNEDLLKILDDMQYPTSNPNQCVVKLIQKLQQCEEFPHEIGLFLGYPPEDVEGFICNQARNYKYIGLWKVYGNELEAKERFETYKKCTSEYCTKIRKGAALEKLVAAL